MCLKVTIGVVLLLTATLPAVAQETDYQARFLLHTQMAPATVGFASWVILPDITEEPDPRLLTLGGLVWKTERQWIEFLFGGVSKKHTSFEPVADVRFSRNLKHNLRLFSEIYYSWSTDQLLVQNNLTRALKVTSGRLLLGAEAEAIFKPDGAIVGVGPRLVVRLPRMGTSSLAVAYQQRSEGMNIVRSYLLIQF